MRKASFHSSRIRFTEDPSEAQTGSGVDLRGRILMELPKFAPSAMKAMPASTPPPRRRLAMPSNSLAALALSLWTSLMRLLSRLRSTPAATRRPSKIPTTGFCGRNRRFVAGEADTLDGDIIWRRRRRSFWRERRPFPGWWLNLDSSYA